MYSTVLSASIQGLEVKFVHVEADISNGLPMFHMVGYLSAEVKEASERVRTAIRNADFVLPAKKIVVNLSPANVRKRGASFDLPIAVSILVSLGYVKGEKIRGILFVGELGLDGSIRKVPGILPIVLEAKRAGCKVCVVPKGNIKEAGMINGIEIWGVESLKELCGILNGDQEPQQYGRKETRETDEEEHLDFADIKGQNLLKRAAEIAAAGNHNILFIGPPGAGKTMIAKRIPTIFPPLSEEESIEVTKIYSILGLTDEKRPFITTPPFRNPHHTSTRAALIGGGTIPGPGEISMANHGVLFLDELPEFRRQVLDVLRQPMEEGYIRLTRKTGTYCFPAQFMLVVAMNPCPCGYYPDLNKCICTPVQVRQYLSHISGPFLDRIDLCVEASKVEYEELYGAGEEETSEDIRKRVCKARKRQYERYGERKVNATLTPAEIEKFCVLGKKEKAFMKQIFDGMSLTVRTYHKILKVARTIADLEQKETITIEHLREAVAYRTMDEKRGI